MDSPFDERQKCLECGVPLKLNVVPISSADKLRWFPEQRVAQGVKFDVVQFLWEAARFEIDQEVIGQENELGISAVGQLQTRGDLPQRKIIFEFFDRQFDLGPLLVEAPNLIGSKVQVGDEHPIGIALQREKSELVVIVLFERMADDNVSARRSPADGLIGERRGLPLVRDTIIAKSGQ
ncbi:MAG TPA: hypothetical protein VL126_11195, partial [Bacteroidota bacterium]|nr:hypothetical protein [Bacteroidota bacterium]